MVVLNDLGLLIEIIGFVLLFITPNKVSSMLLLSEGSDSKWSFLDWRLPDKIGLPLRVLIVPSIVIGLVMQFTFFNI